MAKGKSILTGGGPIINEPVNIDPSIKFPPKVPTYTIVEGRLIVRFKTYNAFNTYRKATFNETVNVGQVHYFAKDTNFDKLSETEQRLYLTLFFEQIKGSSVDMKAIYKRFSGDPNIEYVMFDQVYHLFAQAPSQANEEAQWWFSIINADTALDAYSQNPENISKIAVIDSGIDHKYINKTQENLGHPDLDVNSFLPARNRRDFKNLTWDNNGNLTCSGTGFPIPPGDKAYDGQHGTHVAGIISALNNKDYTVGIAHQSRLMNLWAFPDATERTLAVAIKCAADEKPETVFNQASGLTQTYKTRVINASWGSKKDLIKNPKAGMLLKDAIDYACLQGVVVVCAAGNQNENVENYVPACLENVITVGSVYKDPDEKVVKAPASNYGEKVIGAPGVNINSLNADTDDNLLVNSGTSMATAFVSGLVARMLEINPELGKPGKPQNGGCNIAEAILDKIITLPIDANNSTKILGRGLINVGKTLGI